VADDVRRRCGTQAQRMQPIMPMCSKLLVSHGRTWLAIGSKHAYCESFSGGFKLQVNGNLLEFTKAGRGAFHPHPCADDHLHSGGLKVGG